MQVARMSLERVKSIERPIQVRGRGEVADLRIWSGATKAEAWTE